MKTDVTLKLDVSLLAELQKIAAEEGCSIGDLLAAQLEMVVRHRTAYDLARNRALARLRAGLDLRWNPPHLRDELHRRAPRPPS